MGGTVITELGVWSKVLGMGAAGSVYSGVLNRSCTRPGEAISSSVSYGFTTADV